RLRPVPDRGRSRARAAADPGRRRAAGARAREPARECAQVLRRRRDAPGEARERARRDRRRRRGRRGRRSRARPRPLDRARLRHRQRRRADARAATEWWHARPADVRGMSQRILVVDDEPQFLRALTANLKGAGYEVATATTAEEALAAAGLQPPDATLRDLLVPDGSGTDVTRELRTWTEAPIVLVSAVGDEEEKIAALDAGADDYVTKPFAAGELLARLRAVLRRAGPPGGPVVELGDLRIDRDKDEVSVDGRRVHLTPHEYRILSLLAQHPG